MKNTVSDMANELSKLFQDLVGDHTYYVTGENHVLLAYQGFIQIVNVSDDLEIKTIHEFHHEKGSLCSDHSIIKVDESENYLLAYNLINRGLSVVNTFNILHNNIVEIDRLEWPIGLTPYNEIKLIDKNNFVLTHIDKKDGTTTVQSFEINSDEIIKKGES